jgi:urocanate hydratase
MAFQKKIDTRDMEVGQPSAVILKDGVLASGGMTIEPVDKPVNKEYLDELAFMEEEIEVMVMETSDDNAENPVTVGCNGQFVQFFRGQPTTAKRKFVNSLIVKSGRVHTPEIQVQGVKGGVERSFTIRRQDAQKYPFSVIQDRNPKGVEWLRQRLAELY